MPSYEQITKTDYKKYLHLKSGDAVCLAHSLTPATYYKAKAHHKGNDTTSASRKFRVANVCIADETQGSGGCNEQGKQTRKGLQKKDTSRFKQQLESSTIPSGAANTGKS